MASSDSQIEKPQRGCPKRAEAPVVNINTGMQIINTERASLRPEYRQILACIIEHLESRAQNFNLKYPAIHSRDNVYMYVYVSGRSHHHSQ